MSNHQSQSSWTKCSQKRPAEDELEGEQRLAKRFNLLNLEQNGKFWMNPPDALRGPDNLQARKQHVNNDFMQVEDTKNKVFIHNLEEELAELDKEPDGNRLVFIPDIEKHLAQIPKHILRGGDVPDPSYKPPVGNELVLYSVPSSLSIPPEYDNVRRAILESRARSLQARGTDSQEDAANTNTLPTVQYNGGLARHTTNDEDMEFE